MLEEKVQKNPKRDKDIKIEQTAGAVLFRRKQGKILYLLLQYPQGHWAFPRGHIEEGEQVMDTVRREIKEETGYTRMRFLPGYKEHIKFRYAWPPKSDNQEKRLKYAVFYLGQVFDGRVQISEEHKNFHWASYEKARTMLKHKNMRTVLERAHASVTRRQKSDGKQLKQKNNDNSDTHRERA
ncbi:MAG: NUDIX domain-containing protein [Patescibacteria group bacterium]